MDPVMCVYAFHRAHLFCITVVAHNPICNIRTSSVAYEYLLIMSNPSHDPQVRFLRTVLPRGWEEPPQCGQTVNLITATNHPLALDRDLCLSYLFTPARVSQDDDMTRGEL